jgi:hypothetical protein
MFKKLFIVCLIALAFGCKKKEDPDGQLTVWTSDNTSGQISVKIDNSDAGTIVSSYKSDPGCGANGSITRTVEKGNYKIYATSTGGAEWSGSIEVKSGGCSTFELE